MSAAAVEVRYLGEDELPLDRWPLSLFVPGQARTKGSLKPQGSGRLVESVIGSAAWREQVGQHLAGLLGQKTSPRGIVRSWRPYSRAVLVGAEFYFDRAGDPDPWPIKIRYGDLDKLQRNIGDALVDAGVIADDKLIVSWAPPPRKAWAGTGNPPGCRLRVIAAP